jgi:hypothetical protein
MLIRATLSHNSGKAQPIFGGAMKLYLSGKMCQISMDYPNPTTLKRLKAIEEYGN